MTQSKAIEGVNRQLSHDMNNLARVAKMRQQKQYESRTFSRGLEQE